MGLATGTPCCGCRVVRWRVCTPTIIPWLSHGLNYGRQAAEHIIVGTGNGFLIPMPGGNYVELENTGGNNWDLHVRYNGVGIDTISFTHNFTTSGLKDVEFEWQVGDTYRQVITIILYDDPRPDSFWNLPNRDIPELTHIYLTNVDGFGNYDYAQALLDDSVSTADHQLYTQGFYIARIKKKRDPAIAQSIQYPIQWTRDTGAGTVTPIPVLANESPTHLYFPSSSPTIDFTSYIYEEGDPPLIEKLAFTFTGASFDVVRPVYRPANPMSYHLPFGKLVADIPPDTPPFSVAAIEAIIGTAIVKVELFWRLHYGYIKLIAVIYSGGPTVQGTFEAKNFAIDGSGNWSGTLKWTKGLDVVNVAISGNVVNENLGPSFWPWDDETLIAPLCPKIWFPEYFENQQTIEPTFNWALKKDVLATINGVGAMIGNTFTGGTTGIFYGTDQVDAVIQISSGSLPTGMTASLPSPTVVAGTSPSGIHSTGRSLISVSGTPTANESGSVSFEVELTNDGITQTYISRTYTWKVGTGSFAISYPSPYSTSATPPSGSNDWRIEDGSSPSITCTITGGTGPYTFSVHSGALPTGCTINTTTGEIYAPVPVSGFATTGSVVIKCVDSTTAEAFSVTYDWEYV